MPNNNLTAARRAKNDEFYTQFQDIQKEVEAYLEYDANLFRGKTVYCNCDDPPESNFFGYFALKFKDLGLKRLITTSYKPSPIAGTLFDLSQYESTSSPAKSRPKQSANRFIIEDVGDINSDGQYNLPDLYEQLKANKNNEWLPLKGDGNYPPGDFRSDECVELLKQSDIVVTNPPFSLFREYIKQLFDYNKHFLVIGSMNALKYASIFPLIKGNKIWLGINNGAKVYQAPDSYNQENVFIGEDGKKYTKMGNTAWYTNLDHGRRHRPLPLMTEADIIKFATKKPFSKYDNLDAIDVPLVKNIPGDYNGMMGVPISFLDKYSPDQFEIIGLGQGSLYRELTPKGLNKKFVDNYYRDGGTGSISEDHPILGYYDENGKATIPFMRIIIKHKKK